MGSLSLAFGPIHCILPSPHLSSMDFIFTGTLLQQLVLKFEFIDTVSFKLPFVALNPILYPNNSKTRIEKAVPSHLSCFGTALRRISRSVSGDIACDANVPRMQSFILNSPDSVLPAPVLQIFRPCGSAHRQNKSRPRHIPASESVPYPNGWKTHCRLAPHRSSFPA